MFVDVSYRRQKYEKYLLCSIKTCCQAFFFNNLLTFFRFLFAL